MKRLIGHILTGIKWNAEEVTFSWEGGSAKFMAVGDCCSTTWIDSFDGIGDIIDSPIVRVTFLELPDLVFGRGDDPVCGCRDRRDCAHHDTLSLYGYRIETDTATATLDFRNDSNGYYGGYLEYVETDSEEGILDL